MKDDENRPIEGQITIEEYGYNGAYHEPCVMGKKSYCRFAPCHEAHENIKCCIACEFYPCSRTCELI